MTDSNRSTEVAQAAATPRPSALSSRRKWLFRLGGCALALLPLVVLEVALRLAGYGFDTRLMIAAPDGAASNLRVMNPATDRKYFGRSDLPGPEFRPFQVPKPAGLFRIVVVGGSSVAGFPYPFELSFPRQLEVVLREQNPGRQFEVLNAGIVAISSFNEVDIVRRVLECSPDLIIVHSGHNEFYGVGGLASTSRGFVTPLNPVLEHIRRQRLFQWWASWQDPVDKNLWETLPADIEIPIGGGTFTRVQEYFRANLRSIANQATRAQVPLLLTTVPSNLRDLAPVTSLRNAPLTLKQEQQQKERSRKIAEHLSYNEYELALSLVRASREVEPQHALLAYREAQCLEHMQRRDEAAAAYAEAADLDGCRFRAPSYFAEIVRGAASSHSPRVTFCDVAGQFRQRSLPAAPGEDLFLEYVHYNLDGHWMVALVLGECIQTAVLHGEWSPRRVPDPARRDELLGVTIFDHILGDTFALLALQTWPLKTAPDTDLHVNQLRQRLRSRYAGLTALDQRLFADLNFAGMQYDLLVALGSSYLGAKELHKALHMFELNMVRRPWDARGYQLASDVLERQGNHQRAAETRRRLRQLGDVTTVESVQ